jgi:hypothetical protein
MCSLFTLSLKSALLRPSTAAAGCVKFMIDFVFFAAFVSYIFPIFDCPFIARFPIGWQHLFLV